MLIMIRFILNKIINYTVQIFSSRKITWRSNPPCPMSLPIGDVWFSDPPGGDNPSPSPYAHACLRTLIYKFLFCLLQNRARKVYVVKEFSLFKRGSFWHFSPYYIYFSFPYFLLSNAIEYPSWLFDTWMNLI